MNPKAYFIASLLYFLSKLLTTPAKVKNKAFPLNLITSLVFFLFRNMQSKMKTQALRLY